MLGKLDKRKRDNGEYAFNSWDEYEQKKDDISFIRNYAKKHNTKGMEGEYAFKTGAGGKLVGKGFPRPKPSTEKEIWDYYSDKDRSEPQMSYDEIYHYSLEWLNNNSDLIANYKKGSNIKEILMDEGCKNLGEYIRKCNNMDTIPGYKIYTIFMKKIYTELGVYFEPSMRLDDSNPFVNAWEDFCTNYGE
jgi:hypothetical protein